MMVLRIARGIWEIVCGDEWEKARLSLHCWRSRKGSTIPTCILTKLHNIHQLAVNLKHNGALTNSNSNHRHRYEGKALTVYSIRPLHA
jgi:hypothetical protein